MAMGSGFATPSPRYANVLMRMRRGYPAVPLEISLGDKHPKPKDGQNVAVLSANFLRESLQNKDLGPVDFFRSEKSGGFFDMNQTGHGFKDARPVPAGRFCRLSLSLTRQEKSANRPDRASARPQRALLPRKSVSAAGFYPPRGGAARQRPGGALSIARIAASWHRACSLQFSIAARRGSDCLPSRRRCG